MKTRHVLTTAVCLTLHAMPLLAQADWKDEARAFVKAQGIPLIEVKPGTRFATDLARDRWAWMQRVLLPVLDKHLAAWPEQVERARGLVRQALMARIGHPEVDLSRTPEKLEQEGMELEKAGVNEPLVRYATAWAAWEFREGYKEARDRLREATRHKLLKDYPAAALLMFRTLLYDIEEARNSLNDSDHEDLFKVSLKAAQDQASYAAEDDEIEWLDVRRMFNSQYLPKHLQELETLSNEPAQSPWLREMRQGLLHLRIGWKARGTGYANTVSDAGWKEFRERLPLAAAHFRAAWKLRPDRAVAAAQMVNLLKAGGAERGETVQMWFQRAVEAQLDITEAYYDLVWAVRPRWGGTVEQVKAVLLSAALVDRPETAVSDVVLKLIAFVRSDSDAKDERAVLADPLIQAAVMHTARRLAEEPSRVWEKPWRLGNQAVYAWKCGQHALADKLLQKVPAPFPRQTRRSINDDANEAVVRGESAIHAIGMQRQWAAAVEAYENRDVARSMALAEEVAGAILEGAPALVLEHIAACDFELRFAKGDWVRLQALPDLSAWHHLSGTWKGAEDGTLSIQGHDGAGYLMMNGRVGSSFELRGDYTVEGGTGHQGLSIITGYYRTPQEHFVACAQWAHEGTPVATLLRDFAQTRTAPRLMMHTGDRTWRFHILCKDSRLHFRLNHHDVLIDHLNVSSGGVPYEMPAHSRIGFCSHFFSSTTQTILRHLEIRRVAEDEKAPSTGIEGLHAMMRLELADRAAEAKQAGSADEAAKIEAWAQLVAKAGEKAVPPPAVTLEEKHLHALLRGYQQSVALRNRETPLALQPREPAEVMQALHWQVERGEWSLKDGVLRGSGDSIINYDFGYAPPFQIECDLTVEDGSRARIVMGRVKFANEGSKTTFGLYPQPKGQKLFAYERGRAYHITIKAFSDKTELLVDGVKACDGPKIEGAVELLQFRAGDDYSKGRAAFRNIRIGPLRQD